MIIVSWRVVMQVDVVQSGTILFNHYVVQLTVLTTGVRPF
jgi:hypothetical protein